MASSGHRANILNPCFQHIGIGYAYKEGTDYITYWTMDLGATSNACVTPGATVTPIPTQTRTPTPTGSITGNPTATFTAQPTRTPTNRNGATATPTNTRTPTRTATSRTPTSTLVPGRNLYRFEGHVRNSSTGAGIAGSSVELYRLQRGMWVLVAKKIVGADGSFSFDYSGPDQHFALVERNVSGYGSDSASALAPGIVESADRVTFDLPIGRQTAVAEFYDQKIPNTLTPTATATRTVTKRATATRTFTASVTPTPTSTYTPTPTETPTPKTTTVHLRQAAGAYQGVQDTYLDAWSPTTNHSADRELAIRSGDVRSALVRFDLSTISAQAMITEATLRFYLLGSSNDSQLPVEAYRLLQPWNTSQSPSWASNSLAAREPSPSARAVLSGKDVWASFNIIALTQEWVAQPQNNFGAILRGVSNVAVEYRTASSEYIPAELRPELILSYYVGDEQYSTPTPTGQPQVTPTATVSRPAETMMLREGLDGYYGASDTHLDAWDPARNRGQDRLVIVRSGNTRSALFRFDLDKLPAGAQVQSATLRLYVSESSNAISLPIEVYRLRRSWEELSATWNRASASQAWGQPGADDTTSDREALPEARAMLAQTGAWVSMDITDLVSRWLAEPAQNNGVLIKGAGGSAVEYRFISSDYANENMRPHLTIAYTRP